MKHPLTINPPLLNSANPWATSLEDLKKLYECPYTGAVTTRTSLLDGFPHDDSIHRYTFFDPTSHETSVDSPVNLGSKTASLNTLGYSPFPLRQYLEWISEISEDNRKDGVTTQKKNGKPIIVSVTGSPEEIVTSYEMLLSHQKKITNIPLAMEINLSCPNIPNKPPPAYSASSLSTYLDPLSGLHSTTTRESGEYIVPIGLKLPPYTYADQFATLVTALLETTAAGKNKPCPISFLTSTNTLGTSLLLSPSPEDIIPTQQQEQTKATPTSQQALHQPLPSHGHHYHPTLGSLGGLAGTALHPLSLGNVYQLRRQLFQHAALEGIQIIGVGGVEDAEGFRRMRAVGAAAVGVGTALGTKGVSVFKEIAEGAGIVV